MQKEEKVEESIVKKETVQSEKIHSIEEALEEEEIDTPAYLRVEKEIKKVEITPEPESKNIINEEKTIDKPTNILDIVKEVKEHKSLRILNYRL